MLSKTVAWEPRFLVFPSNYPYPTQILNYWGKSNKGCQRSYNYPPILCVRGFYTPAAAMYVCLSCATSQVKLVFEVCWVQFFHSEKALFLRAFLRVQYVWNRKQTLCVNTFSDRCLCKSHYHVCLFHSDLTLIQLYAHQHTERHRSVRRLASLGGKSTPNLEN